MNKDLNNDHQFEIIKFLYQFKDDNKYYKLDQDLLNDRSHDERYDLIYNLRDNAMIATDREIYYNSSAKRFVYNYNNDEIKAKILPKGIVAVETLLK